MDVCRGDEGVRGKGRGKGRGRSGPPVAAWPGRHGDPWSLCSCSPALSADKPSPRKIPSSENLRANAEWRSKGDVAAYTLFRGFVTTREPKNPPRKGNNRVCILFPSTSYFTKDPSDLSRVRTSDYAALIKRVRRKKRVRRCFVLIIGDFKVRFFSICWILRNECNFIILYLSSMGDFITVGWLY